MQEVFDELRSALHTVWNRRWLALAVARRVHPRLAGGGFHPQQL